MTTILAPVLKERFTDSAGNPLVGGKVFIYLAGTNTKTVSYTDSTGTVLNSNPVILDSRGEANIWLDVAIAYKFVLSPSYDTDPPTAAIWTTDNVPAANTAPSLALTAFIASLLTSAGSTFINFLQSGTSAVLRSINSVLLGRVRVRDYAPQGVWNGSTDVTAYIQAAVNYAAQAYPPNSWYDIIYATLARLAPRTVDFEGVTGFVSSKILVPTGITLEGNQCTLIGTGNLVSSNTCFETAYWNGTALVTNIGTANESQVIQGLRIQNMRFMNFGVALNLFNACEGCSFTNLDFGECYQAIHAKRCFYSAWIGIFIRENIALSASTAPAIYLEEFTNVIAFDSVAISQRLLAIQCDGAVNGWAPKNLAIESCTNGIKFIGEAGPLNLDGAYFENVTGIAIDMSVNNGGKTVTIDNCWFNGCGTAISGINMFGGHIGPGNRYVNCTIKVNIPDANSFINIDIPITNVSDVVSTVPTLPSGWILGTSVRVFYPVTVISNVSNIAQIRSNTLVNNFADLPYFGQSGHVTNQIAFCTVSHTGTTTATAIVDTYINFDVYVLGIYFIKIVDSTGTIFIAGRFCGTNVFADSSAGKTVVISNNGGYVRLSITTFNGVIDNQFEGIVRMV